MPILLIDIFRGLNSSFFIEYAAVLCERTTDDAFLFTVYGSHDNVDDDYSNGDDDDDDNDCE